MSDLADLSAQRVASPTSSDTDSEDNVPFVASDYQEPVVTRKELLLSDDASGQCVVRWGPKGTTKAVASVVLVANGISFAMMTLVFTTIGSAADYGTFGRTIPVACGHGHLLGGTVCLHGSHCLDSLHVRTALSMPEAHAGQVPSRLPAAMTLFIIGYVTYGAMLVFYAAAFPRLARNTARTRELEAQYRRGEINKEELDLGVSLEKNRISNISTVKSLLVENY